MPRYLASYDLSDKVAVADAVEACPDMFTWPELLFSIYNELMQLTASPPPLFFIKLYSAK